MERVQELTFKYRAVIMAVVAIGLLLVSKPTPKSIGLGIPLVVLGEIVRVWSLSHIGNKSRSQEAETEQLTVTGPYSLTRNPLYWGNYLDGLGITIMAVGNYPLLQALAVIGFITLIYYTVYVMLCIPYEERYLRERFGESYEKYSRSVPRLSWRLSNSSKLLPGSLWNILEALRLEIWTLIWLSAIIGVLIWRAPK